jgi:hypothetical protein
MANEFKVRKGLLVEASGSTSGSTLIDVQGTVGQVFSVTDNLIGSIFSVNDISGIPLLDVNSNGTVVGGVATEVTTAEIHDGISSISGDLKDWDSNYVSGEIIKNQILGESVSYGQCLVLMTDTEWFKADQTVENKSSNMLGIALQAGSSSDTISILIKGFYETEYIEDPATTAGSPLYIQEGTAGNVSSTIPTTNFVRLIGYQFIDDSNNDNSVSIVRFDPDNTWVEL